MAEERMLPQNPNSPSFQISQPQLNILNMTLGELLNNNPTAQNIVMQSMKLNSTQFQQLLSSASNNQMMNMTISDLFKNGTITQAMQVNPQQVSGLTVPSKQTIFQKLINLFR